MTCELAALRFFALDPERLATFWAGVLGWEQSATTLTPTDDTGFALRFVATDVPRAGRTSCTST